MKKKQGRGFIWTKKDEDDLIRLYNITKMKDLAVYFGRSKAAINRKALKMGLKRDLALRDYNRGWTKDEEEYIKNNYEFGDLNKIAKTIKRTRKAITERAKILKLKRDEETVRKQHQKYSVNEQFFGTWSNNMAYILGLICADGNMSKVGNTVSICLHKDDAYLFGDVLKNMGSTHKVKLHDNENKKMSSISVTNKHLYNDLLKLGVTPNKSKTLKCPDVPKEFIPHFIRGVMDGDGSVDSKNKRMKIVSASKDFIDGLSDMLKIIDIGHAVYNEPYTHNNIKTDFYTIRVLRRFEVKSLYNLMYKYQRLYLNRKKQAFIDMGVLEPGFDDLYSCNRKAIIGIHKDTKKVVKFDSIKAAIDARICNKKVHQALNGTVPHHNNYTWKYAP